jgi:hypothetical protein
MGKFAWSDKENERREERRPVAKPRQPIKKKIIPAHKISNDSGLLAIVKTLDSLFSTHRRIQASNGLGIINCYCCEAELHYKEAQLMHFKDRDYYALRWDMINTQVGCQGCNVYQDGNLKAFADHLERDQPGIITQFDEIIQLPFKLYRSELLQSIEDYTRKLAAIKTLKGL